MTPSKSSLIDHIDLMVDEFKRIRALNPSSEILGLCDRALRVTEQNVPVIEQRFEGRTDFPYGMESIGMVPLYTHPASADEWIKCGDRLPTDADGDCEGMVWVNDRNMTLPKYAQSRVHWSRVRGIAGYTHWVPTGFRRPQPPKQEKSHD